MPEQETLILKHVGEQIRLYRKKRNMTVTQLAERIYKSKATVSKYEQGQIAVDIATLYSIAEVLEIPVRDLIDYIPENKPKTTAAEEETFFYMYNISTNSFKILTSVIRVLYTGNMRDQICSATLYYDSPACNQWQKCDHIYHGTAVFSEYVTTLTLQNYTWYREHVHILLSTALKADRIYQGIILGLSETTLWPTANKVILTTKPFSSMQKYRRYLSFLKKI